MKKIFSFVAAALFCATINAQQLNESFEGDDFPPEGWEVVNGSPTSCWKKGVAVGQNCAQVPACYGVENYLITPQLKPAAGEKLTFSARIKENTASGELRIEVSLAGTEKESFDVVETFYTSSKKGDEAHRLWLEWHEFTVDLSAYKNQRIYVAFHQAGEIGNGGLSIDDVKGVTLAGNADCNAPTNLKASNITDKGATLTWDGDAAQYQYVLVADGESLNWNNAVLTSDKNVTFTTLDEDQSYVFYVRSYCSADVQSLEPKVAFKTTCALQAIPWLETFTRDKTGSGFVVAEPECWTIASENPLISVVADKTYDEEGGAQVQYGQAHLQAMGGGANSVQVFAMPAFDAQLNTLEVAFDYKTNLSSPNCGTLEVGYMTNPSKASTFVSLQTLQPVLDYTHAVVTLEDLPATAKFIAFRFAGGTSEYGSLAMDNFIVAEIGKSKDVDPSKEDVPDEAIWSQTYCQASFTWYSYNNEAFAIGLFDAEAQALVAGIVVTTSECDRFAYEDIQTGEFDGFKEDDDYENHYYCSTKWIVNASDADGGLAKGDSWSKCVINIGTATSPVLALKAGKYQVQIYPYSTATGQGSLLASIPFELVSKEVSNLRVEVSGDKKTAELSWDEPELTNGERLYVSVRAGESVAYDNFESKEVATSPLIVNVEEGKSYTATVQVVDKKNNPIGREIECLFTVGVNKYEPTNLKAEVFGGDNVTFSWEVAQAADIYEVMLYLEGAYYASLNVTTNTKTTTMPKDGKWSWTVQAFTKGTNGKYFPVSNVVAGPDYTTKAADVPEDAIVMDVWGMEAAYLDEYTDQFPEGKYGWYITFATGEEGGTGFPMPTFLIYTDKELAISGVYNVARQGIDAESCYINLNGRQSDAIMATDAELRLQFDGFDEEYLEQGYGYGYYTGSFRLVGADGKTYVGKFMEMFCNSFNFSTYGSTVRDHVAMWDEEPNAPHAIEEVLEQMGIDLTQPMFNISGQRVDATYKGIVIQKGKKFLLQ